MKSAFDRQFDRWIDQLLETPDVRRMNEYLQHGTTTCLHHGISVAYHAARWCAALGKTDRLDAVVRAGLLHDMFLYDWHDGHPSRRIHGFTHPRRALENARACFSLSPLEEQIIRCHMWPLTLRPPLSLEALMVCLADKYCSAAETLAPRIGAAAPFARFSPALRRPPR